jgi:CO dehydrogenase/acetyl-CoA synthase beta subunit
LSAQSGLQDAWFRSLTILLTHSHPLSSRWRKQELEREEENEQKEKKKKKKKSKLRLSINNLERR